MLYIICLVSKRKSKIKIILIISLPIKHKFNADNNRDFFLSNNLGCEYLAH